VGDDPQNEAALSMLGLIAAQKRDWAGASRTISKAVNTNPSDPSGQNMLVLAELNSTRNTDLAVSRLKKLVSSYPDYAPAAYNLAAIYDHWLGQQTAAVGWYQEYLRKSGPAGSHAEAARQAIARLGGQTVAASGPTKPQSDPAAAARFMAEGARLHQQQKYAEAVGQYQKAIAADPVQKNAFYNMGLAYYALKRYPETEQACISALKVDPGFADSQYMLTLAYVQQGMWNEAEREAKILAGLDARRGDEMLKYIASARK